MIEDGKKCILTFFCTAEELNIVNNQYINQLIEMNKIIDCIVTAMINKLINKFFTAHIQNHFGWMQSFHFSSDGLCKVGLTQSYSTINHQWIKRVGSRIVC